MTATTVQIVRSRRVLPMPMESLAPRMESVPETATPPVFHASVIHAFRDPSVKSAIWKSASRCVVRTENVLAKAMGPSPEPFVPVTRNGRDPLVLNRLESSNVVRLIAATTETALTANANVLLDGVGLIAPPSMLLSQPMNRARCPITCPSYCNWRRVKSSKLSQLVPLRPSIARTNR